jgi:hypothetical protein
VIIKTEAASTLAFGREIARTGSRRRLGEGRWAIFGVESGRARQ